MLFVDPEKLAELTEAAIDCLKDVRDAQGLRVQATMTLYNPELIALAFLTMLTGLGPFVSGNTVFITGFGTDKEAHWPQEPVRFPSKGN